jgi:tetratricopeptide (TPR) repeat protein
LGQPARALDELTMALTRFQGDDYWAHRLAGTALRALDRPVEAIDHYRHALELSPDAHDLRYHVGLLYEQLDRLDEARAWWQDYLAHQPAGPLAPAAHEHLHRTSDN